MTTPQDSANETEPVDPPVIDTSPAGWREHATAADRMADEFAAWYNDEGDEEPDIGELEDLMARMEYHRTKALAGYLLEKAQGRVARYGSPHPDVSRPNPDVPPYLRRPPR